MTADGTAYPVYLEVGQKRVVAGALDWPGWCRIGRDEATALAALSACRARYAAILRDTEYAAALGAAEPTFTVIERIAGDSSTDFGVPSKPPGHDLEAYDDAAIRRDTALLTALWRGFDAAVTAATGGELRRGPRGGGRDLDGVVWHTLQAERSYLARRGWKIGKAPEDNPVEAARLIRQGVLDALGAAVRGEVPQQGPRGGAIWPARYFVRRVAWHVVDHHWEIEDRATA
jgi:hypothetical protein